MYSVIDNHYRKSQPRAVDKYNVAKIKSKGLILANSEVNVAVLSLSTTGHLQVLTTLSSPPRRGLLSEIIPLQKDYFVKRFGLSFTLLCCLLQITGMTSQNFEVEEIVVLITTFFFSITNQQSSFIIFMYSKSRTVCNNKTRIWPFRLYLNRIKLL